jgi:hypothetical protein
MVFPFSFLFLITSYGVPLNLSYPANPFYMFIFISFSLFFFSFVFSYLFFYFPVLFFMFTSPATRYLTTQFMTYAP